MIGNRVLGGARNLLVAVAAAAVIVTGMTGCKGQQKIIDKVTFSFTDNLEAARVSLVFAPNIQSDFSGSFQVKDYGNIFINPYTATEPFEIGFYLNTAIVNDQNYVHLAPTSVLPNGVPIGIPYPVVEIHGDKPISSAFDLFAYADVSHLSWLGAAGMFSFINNQYFPDGLSITQVFKRDGQGMPEILGSVFGPVVNSDGTLARAGGVAIFANVRQLIADIHSGKIPATSSFKSEEQVYLSGPAAKNYRGNALDLMLIQNNLINGFNALH